MFGGKPARGSRPAASPRQSVDAPPPSLPPRQLECLRYLDAYRRAHGGRFPTHREIARALGLRSTTAAVYLDPLQQKRLLKRAGRMHRGWRITPLGECVLRAAAADASAADAWRKLPDVLSPE